MSQATGQSSVKALVQHPLLKELYEYWERAGASGGRALKSKFDPVDLPAALWPRLHMIDVPERRVGSCRNRLLGTYVVDAVGKDFTGRRLVDDEIPSVSTSITYRLLQQLLASAQPQHYLGPPSFELSNRFAAHEQILLPLFDGAGALVVAVGALDYQGFEPGLFDHKRD